MLSRFSNTDNFAKPNCHGNTDMSSTVVTVKKALSQRRIRRRRCKFIGTWLCHRQFKRWLTPVRGDNHKAYCALCDKVFSVAHGGLHDVRAHWKGKRHISLESSLSQSQRAQRLQRAAGLVDRSHLVPSASSYRNRKLLLGRVEPDDVEFCEQVCENSSLLTTMQPLHQHR